MATLPLTFENGMHLKIREDRFSKTKDELEEFIHQNKHLNTKTVAKNVMFSHELKANNQVEGYFDDVRIVESIIAKRYGQSDSEQVKRILNLYHGYHYILNNKNINKDTLKKLYSILSKGLLKEEDLKRMGEYYRNAKVYILFNGNLSNPDEGINEQRIDEFMEKYFEFLNNADYSETLTDEYIKSQILHFYFVYIHPYFDVNGRTSRTLSMWYLLNKKAYSYIIFNRGIAFQGSKYDRTIMDVKKYKDISYFIEFMLQTVQAELEKEYIMEVITNSTNSKLSSLDYQSLLYLLSMNGLITTADFATFYNRYNDKKHYKEIYDTMIEPLISKGIIIPTRNTNREIFNGQSNQEIIFNPHVMDYDRSKIKRLTRYK